MRSSVVLPEPDGPSSATSSPDLIVEIDARASAAKAPKLLVTLLRRRDLHRARPSLLDSLGRSAIRAATLAISVTSASSASSEATANGADELVFVVENLDMQRHRVGLAADMAGNHRDRAEFAHRARIAQQHAVEQRPFHVRQRDAEERLQAARRRATSAASSSCVPCSCISGISSRATKGKVTKIVASTMPGTREDDLDVVRLQASAPKKPCAPNSSTNTRPEMTGRDRERQIDQRDQQALCRGTRIWRSPRRRSARRRRLSAHRDRRDQEREPDGGDRVGIGQRAEIGADAPREGLHGRRCHQRQHQEDREKRRPR